MCVRIPDVNLVPASLWIKTKSQTRYQQRLNQAVHQNMELQVEVSPKSLHAVFPRSMTT